MTQKDMSQKNKQLVFVDLCARLPYHVRVKIWLKDGTTEEGFLDLEHNYANVLQDAFYYNKIKDIKPYLRPMSSMTEEEMDELKTLCSIYIPTYSPTIGFEEYGIIVFTHHLTNNTYSFKLNVNVIDWLNKNMFDYRDLIPKGLAIAVTKENNPYED